MRKTSITSQIVLVFLCVVLSSVSAFSLITLTRIRVIAEEETYTRLIAYSNLFDFDNVSNSDPGDFRDMEIEYYVTRGKEEKFSSSIFDYLNPEEIEKIFKDSQEQKNFLYVDKIVKKDKETIYYVFQKTNNDYLIFATNSAYIQKTVRKISMQMIFLFSSITILSVLVIAWWSVNFVGRIHKIQDQILDLPNKNSKRKPDLSLDEIGELSRAVEDMRQQINQTETVKREMLQNISHDFKTPIAVIKSYAEAIEDGMADEEASKIIINQAEILKNKVNRLLQYNSLEYLSKDKEFEDVDMKEIIEEVIKTYKFQTNLEIDLDLAENIYFKGYRENYYTVVDNIIDNAKRYAKTKIKVVLRKNRLRIYNDGEHIGEQFLNSVFKPYEKGDKGQFGLGMSIVKKTVEFFGMELRVKNEPIGVSFIITKL